MKKKKTVSIILSVVFGAVGVLFIYTFFSAESRGVIEFVLGACLLFLAIFNLYLTLKSSRK
ncbi:MAG: hypothetical protein GX213_11785 [Clostridiaceae bacterium]|nr:hypothetical protein [Clostridiaceae bacterium]